MPEGESWGSGPTEHVRSVADLVLQILEYKFQVYLDIFGTNLVYGVAHTSAWYREGAIGCHGKWPHLSISMANFDCLTLGGRRTSRVLLTAHIMGCARADGNVFTGHGVIDEESGVSGFTASLT